MSDKSVRIFQIDDTNSTNWPLVHVIGPFDQYVRHVDWSQQNGRLAVGLSLSFDEDDAREWCNNNGSPSTTTPFDYAAFIFNDPLAANASAPDAAIPAYYGDSYGVSISWSPAGDMLAVGRRSQAYESCGKLFGGYDYDDIVDAGNLDLATEIYDTTNYQSLGHLDLTQTASLRAGGGEHVWRLAWSPDGLMLATGSKFDILAVFEVDKSVSPALWPLALSYKGADDIYSVAWSVDGHYLAAGHNTLEIFELDAASRTFNHLETIPTADDVNTCDWIPTATCEKQLLVCGDDDGYVYARNFSCSISPSAPPAAPPSTPPSRLKKVAKTGLVAAAIAAIAVKLSTPPPPWSHPSAPAAPPLA